MLPLIAGNWKMNGLAAQLGEIAAIAASVKAVPPAADILICLPATLIARAARIAAGCILALPEVGGALVGGASRKPADFEAIFRAVPATA